MIKFFLTSFIIFFTLTGAAQRCTLMSIDHFGGDQSDGILPPGFIKHTDGKFSLALFTNSITGNIFTGCSNQNLRRFYKTYEADYSGIVSQTCAPIPTNFSHATFFVFPQSNGDTIFIGSREMPSGQGGANVGIVRQDSNGNVLWSKNYGGTGDESPGFVVQTADSGFYVATMTNTATGDIGLHHGSEFEFDIWVIKLNNNGDLLWSKVLGGTYTDMPRDLKVAPDEGCYIFGVTASSDLDAVGMKGGTDLLVIKLDSLGNKEWHKCLGGSGIDGSGFDLGIKVLPDNNGGFYILNKTNSQDGDIQHRIPQDEDFWLLHVDSMANILWENTFGGPGSQTPTSICLGLNGAIWMGGYLSGNTTVGGYIDQVFSSEDGWVVQADTEGNFINQLVIGAYREQQVTSLYRLPDGSILAAGYYQDNSFDPMHPMSEMFPTVSEGDQDIFIAHLNRNTVDIKEPSWSKGFKIFPSPSADKVTFQVKKEINEVVSLTIMDMYGKIILSTKLSGSVTLNIKPWSNGVYTATIQYSKRSVSKKFTIHH